MIEMMETYLKQSLIYYTSNDSLDNVPQLLFNNHIEAF